jgi:mannose-6-phosphate isomerase-like protein (cupin superfamily)
MPEGWKTARLDEIGSRFEPGFWDPWAREPGYGENWRSIGPYFGITGFGVSAYEVAEGEELVVAHDEVEYGGQEELYFLVRGRARFVLDGEEVELGEGELLYVRPQVTRQATALATPTLVFMVGGTPGKPYQEWDSSS